MNKLKKAVSLSLILFMLTSLLACGTKSGYRHTLNTIDDNLNLDFEFLQKMDNVDLTAYHAYEDTVTTDYVSDAYWDEYKSDGEYVLYSVSPFPNYTSESIYVTKIYISDPNVSFFGCTLNSGSSAIQDAFEKAGFTVENKFHNGATRITADLGNGMVMGVYISATERYFAIAAKVSENSRLIIDWR